MHPFFYRGCHVRPETLTEPVLAGCNNGVNRHVRRVWRVTFPGGSWFWCGTRHRAMDCIDSHTRLCRLQDNKGKVA